MFSAVKGFFSKRFACVAMALALCVCMCMTAFASTGTADVGITTEMLEPVIDSVTGAIGIILPIGLALFAIFLGINIIPKLFKKFAH